MTGFRKFLLQGNLVEVAVAFVIGAAFGDVVKTFTDVFTSIIGKIFGGKVSASSWHPGGVPLGSFINAVIAFVILAAIIYFFVILPYQKLKDRFFPAAPAGPSETDLLAEIRDAIKAKGV